MKMSRFLVLILVMALAIVLLPTAARAQDTMEPSVTVSDQVVTNSWVTIASVYYNAPGFIVIHADSDGSIGPVIGYRQLSVGLNTNVEVWIDAAQATSTLYAMLHADTGTAGVYEFGTVDGADGPVSDSAGNVVTPPFHVTVLNVKDQLPGDTYTAASVTVDTGSWLVIHSEADGAPGPVLGQTFVEAGITTNVEVAIAAEGRTDNYWPMLHVDDGVAGTYEFGTVEGADAPIAVDGKVATVAVSTQPTIRALPQIVTYGDSMAAMMEGMAPSFTAMSVLAAEPGFLVIHSEADGAPGPVAGYVAVPAGLSENVVVELDPANVTPNLWPMLHVDTGESGVYEFGTVEGADGPVTNSAGDVVTFQVNASPAIHYEGEYLDATTLKIHAALIDGPGWLTIHADNGSGEPGPVIGQTLLVPGLNHGVVITLDEAGITDTLFPMLHYDDNTLGTYEFGAVEGADLPVFVGGAPVFGPLVVEGM